MKKIGLLLVLVLVFTFFIGTTATVVYADSSGITDTIKDIKGASSVIDDNGGNGAKAKIRGISKDALDIVMIIVTAFVVISGVITGAQFAGAGDDPTKKAKLKTKLIFHILGLIFLANYFGLFNFLFESLQIFE